MIGTKHELLLISPAVAHQYKIFMHDEVILKFWHL